MGKTLAGVRDTVSPNQVKGSMLKGIRGQSSQDFHKFCDLKTIKLPFSGILLYLFNLPCNYKIDIVSFPTKYNKFEYYFQFV